MIVLEGFEDNRSLSKQVKSRGGYFSSPESKQMAETMKLSESWEEFSKLSTVEGSNHLEHYFSELLHEVFLNFKKEKDLEMKLDSKAIADNQKLHAYNTERGPFITLTLVLSFTTENTTAGKEAAGGKG